MEITTIPHPIHNMTLRFNRKVTPPAFETAALAVYKEMHDRVWETKQRINGDRTMIPGFRIQVEELADVLRTANEKLQHLMMAYDTNPYKPTIRKQLIAQIDYIKKMTDEFVPTLLQFSQSYYAYSDYRLEQEKWMTETAFPQVNTIIKRYQECSVDLVFFDEDLDDFKGKISFIGELEKRYYREMDDLLDEYDEVNDKIQDFYDAVEQFDEDLLYTSI
ncbi:hypothetical protein G5B30_07040 [Sphingobacterium sp. SGG-5]|uniref:hypothetical protein n=1 Tax=Sphingobacterium sp. SGG-5 TaxID=2710881 RepID=UPI0013EB9E8E|nr:hypothetical protein [Sphingobacterium sp. SGG-5]NGM61671.1 hypothetical protein [Sphingobacterium sp. SGG-5]